MLNEAMRFGLPEAVALFEAPPEQESSRDDSVSLSKEERGRAEGAVLGSIRHSLAQRCGYTVASTQIYRGLCPQNVFDLLVQEEE